MVGEYGPKDLFIQDFVTQPHICLSELFSALELVLHSNAVVNKTKKLSSEWLVNTESRNILNRKRNVAQKNTILNSPYIYTMNLSICVMIKFWCSGNLLLLNFL